MLTQSAAEFRANCLKILDEVHAHHTEVIITKRGVPIAKLTYLDEAPKKSIIGALKGTGVTQADLTEPFDEWDENE